jgi:hypothetical protein
VPAVDLVGRDSQALPRDAAKETGREQAVVTTDQDPRRDVGPDPERRRLPQPGLRLGAPPVQRLGGQLRRDVLVEEGDRTVVPVPRLIAVSRIGPVVGGRLRRRGDHGRDQHEQFHCHPVADERGGEAAKRLRDDDQIGPVADRAGHAVGVLGKAGRVIVAWKIRSDGVMAAGT